MNKGGLNIDYSKGWTKVPKKLLSKECNLTIRERLILIYLLSLPKGEKVSINKIKRVFSMHRNIVEKSAKGLIKKNYKEIVFSKITNSNLLFNKEEIQSENK